MKRAKDYMKKDVISFGPHDSLFDVAQVFSEKKISGAPVVEGRDVVGIITVSDIMKFMQVKLPQSNFLTHEPHSLSMMVAGMIKQNLDFQEEVKKISNTLVKDFMTADVVTIKPDTTLIEVAETLDKHKIDRLPILNDKGRLVGIISRTDLLRGLLD